DEEMVPMDGKTVGEIVICGTPKSTCSYCNAPELTEKKFHNGWMYTGDLASWDDKGYVRIIGRKDDMIVSAGENIYPTQVEAILNEHPKVAESLVLGIADPKRGKVVVALIKKADPSLTEQEMKQFCLEHPMLSPYKRPRLYRFLEDLPHNATGKLLHKMPEGVTF
ncbi:MAG: AMP-binding protein, partial [Desulfovibrionaceae bacterium]|nr:AMP-binding protein [Desulfovibrionaceae bacterium]